MNSKSLTLSLFSAIAALCASSAAQAQLAGNAKLVKDIPVDFTPSYFFKISGDGKNIVYTLFRNNENTGEQNYMLNIDGNGLKGQATEIPGDFDPMFNQDGMSMTIPIEKDGDYVCGFYSEADVRKLGRDAQPKLVDDSMRCVYQSVGLLSSDNLKSTFRLILETSAGFAMRDYQEDKKTGEIHAISERKALCPGWNIKLPMISKTGHDMGAFDLGRGSSVILNVKDDGTCKLDTDLKVIAGKMSFSYDGKRVAFHVFSNPDQSLVTDFIETPGDGYTSDVFVYNRTSRFKQQVTKNKTSNAMFPEFTRDGNVIFVDHPNDETKKVHFVVIKPY